MEFDFLGTITKSQAKKTLYDVTIFLLFVFCNFTISISTARNLINSSSRWKTKSYYYLLICLFLYLFFLFILDYRYFHHHKCLFKMTVLCDERKLGNFKGLLQTFVDFLPWGFAVQECYKHIEWLLEIFSC